MKPYLYEHPNPNAPVRSNGIRFHGYPTRINRVRIIGVHTAENTPDEIGIDGGAEAVASYQSRVVRPSSYHEIGDSDSFVYMLPPAATAFGAKNANSDGWHWSFGTKAALWNRMSPDWRNNALRIAAARCRLRALQFGVPLRRISRQTWLSGGWGFIAHGDIDPDRRSDPGATFPWAQFITLVKNPEPDKEPTMDELNDYFYPLKGAKSDRVGEIQWLLKRALGDDALPEYGVDNDYGNETASELGRFLHEWNPKRFPQVIPVRSVGPWLYVTLTQAAAEQEHKERTRH